MQVPFEYVEQDPTINPINFWINQKIVYSTDIYISAASEASRAIEDPFLIFDRRNICKVCQIDLHPISKKSLTLSLKSYLT